MGTRPNERFKEMETLMEQQLTKAQTLMVIEYFAQQAAEDMPDADYTEAEKHMWRTRFQTSLAIDRRIGAWWWDSLVECERDLQRFDRDPDAYMFENDAAGTKESMAEHLKNQVSWSIDNLYRNSGA